MLREVGLLLLLAFSAWSIVRYLFADGGPAVFDYIVVGGGSTGAVVAGRLGEAGYSVLVLEAGGSTQISLGGDAEPVAGKWTIFDVPLGWVQVLSDHRWSKEFQWVVPADPPPAIARGLGGCGIHNAMLYMRGRPADFAEWGAGWSWDDVRQQAAAAPRPSPRFPLAARSAPQVLPFYKRSEDNEQFGSSPLHGTGGPVRVTTVASDELSDFFLDVCRSSLDSSLDTPLDTSCTRLPRRVGLLHRRPPPRRGLQRPGPHRVPLTASLLVSPSLTAPGRHRVPLTASLLVSPSLPRRAAPAPQQRTDTGSRTTSGSGGTSS